LKASRAEKPLAALQSFLDGIVAGTEAPHPVIDHVVSFYRREGRLLTLDTSDLSPELAVHRAVAFLEQNGVI
jgi:hypothetical protein